jgi:DNA repair photolyase
MGIYNGCEMGCPYCDGWVYNPQSFNEMVRVPLNLPQRMQEELARIDRGDVIAITALSDPYQPAEQSFRITRQVLQLFAEVGQPCVLLTKSPHILDDIPLLQRLHERSLALVMTTLVTTNRSIAERLEAKTAAPALRLDMLAALKRAGIPVGVAMVPVIPYVNDTTHSVQRLLEACAERGIDFVIWDYLHIPNRRHNTRIQEMLTYVGNYPNRYYRDLYGEHPLPNADYRAERSREILSRCDQLGIEPHVPHRVYAGRIAPRNEAALLLKHTAFRSMLTGHYRMADQHQKLADMVYRNKATAEQLRASTLWKKLQPLLHYSE